MLVYNVLLMYFQLRVIIAGTLLRLNITFCVRPLTLIDFNTKRALTHAQWPMYFSNVCMWGGNVRDSYPLSHAQTLDTCNLVGIPKND